MADQATEKLQNMSLQDYDSSEFDPLSPQNCNPPGNFPYTDTQGVDLLGDFGGVTNGHGKTVTFGDEALGLPDPLVTGGQGQGQPPRTSSKEQFQRHMSEGEILGYQNEYGESVTHQMEYGLDSDEEDDENNLVDFGDSQQNGRVTYPHVDTDYLMSTGQPLLDFNDDLQQPAVPASEPQDLLGAGNFEGDYSSQGLEQYQNQEAMEEGEYAGGAGPDYGQEEVENDYKSDDIAGNNWQPEMEAEQRGGVDQSEDRVEDNWQPQMDPERSRRSLTPERSLSPSRGASQSGGLEGGVGSPQCDTESYENLDSEDISSVSDCHNDNQQQTHQHQQPIPHSDADYSEVSQGEQWESDSLASDASGVAKFRSGIARPKKIKKPKELPPWNDNVVLPKQPRMRPTFIGNKEYLPTASSSPDRPKTAPVHYIAKDASSDSGVEGDEANKERRNSEDGKKKYGTDSKNDHYKPGGGEVKIYNKKMDTKHVAPRTDTKTPRSALGPRSPVKSPTPPRASTPNTRQIHSKIGSLNNVKHNPGGGNIQILSAKTDFSNVRSKVGSKDKIDHKPKGGDKKIESRKLDWKTDSRIGSLKNATHSPGGGNVKIVSHRPTWSASSRIGSLENATHTPGGGKKKIESHRPTWSATSRVGSLENATHVAGGGKVKILDQKVEVKAQSKVGSTANMKHKPGGGDKRIETQKTEFTEKAKSKVGSMDKIQHKPGGGDIKVFNENLAWDTSSKVQSLANAKHRPGGGDVKVIDEKLKWDAASKVESLVNIKHVPGGGEVKILDEKVDFQDIAKSKILDEKVDFQDIAKSKVGSMDKVKHKPGGGDKKVGNSCNIVDSHPGVDTGLPPICNSTSSIDWITSFI